MTARRSCRTRARSGAVDGVSTAWPYDKVPNALQTGTGRTRSRPIGSLDHKAGIRGHSMRTPAQRQQNFALESIVNEARRRREGRTRSSTGSAHDRPRLITVLNTLKTESRLGDAAVTEPEAHRDDRVDPGQGPGAGRDDPLRRSLGRRRRHHGDPKTGKILVDKYTVVLDPGIVINPLQLKRITEGGRHGHERGPVRAGHLQQGARSPPATG